MIRIQRTIIWIAISMALLSCETIDEVSGDAKIIFNFATPVDVISTKGDFSLDTNSFILSIVNVNGDVVYNGAYGSRPSELSVKAGTYEISVISNNFDKPDFDSPQYGDNLVIVVSNGQTVHISFMCKMTNACIKLSFTDRFTKKYGTSGVALTQGDGMILYGITEDRSAYFNPGNVEFLINDNSIWSPLFNRVIKAGEFHSLQLDASNDESNSEFSIQVDTSMTYISDLIIVGDDNGGANGYSAQRAMSLSDAIKHEGDTLWVWGFISGATITTSSFNSEPPFDSDAHIAISQVQNAKERSEIYPVELSKKSLKSALGLATNPSNLGKRIAVRGVIVSSYLGSVGIKSVTDFVIQLE